MFYFYCFPPSVVLFLFLCYLNVGVEPTVKAPHNSHAFRVQIPSQSKKKVTWSQQTVLKHSIEQYALHMWQSESGLSRAVCQWFNNGVSRSDWCRLNRLHAGEPWRDPRFREFATWSPIRMALELKQTFFASYFCSYFLYYYFLVIFFLRIFD